MSLLEAIFCTELLFLFSAWVLWIAGRMVARNSPNDAILKFASVWWRTFAQCPAPLREVVPDADDVESIIAGDDQQILGDLADTSDREAKEDEEDSRRLSLQQETGVRMATLNIKVVPHASRDQICGYLGNALKIQVMAPAEGGKANKAVIDVLAESLGVKPHQIQLLRGHFNAEKVLQIAGLTQAQLDQKLSNFQ